MALSWEDSKKYALAGGSSKYESPEAWLAQQSAVPAPPAAASAPSSTTPAPWMGNMYSNVPGTDMYSTNPSNPNSTKYKADGTPVPSLSFDFTKTGGGSYDGYTTPEQFAQIRSAPNPAAAAGVMSGMLNSGQLNQSNDAIYNATAVPAPPSMVKSFMQSSGGGSAPSSGIPAPRAYGGGNYNDLSYEDRLKMQNDADRIKNDPAFRQSEIERTLGVISGMQGQDTSAQNDYLYRVLGYQPNQVAAPQSPGSGANQSGVPAPTGYPAMSQQQIRAEVEARIAAETQKRVQAAAQAKHGLQATYDRLRTNVGQDRVLQDMTASRNANPFSGKTSYDKGITNMERERSDREQSQDFATRLATIDIALQDYMNATPEQQRQMENELIRQERAYAADVAQLTGNMADGTRTLAGKQFDYNTSPTNPNNIAQNLQNQLAQLKLDNYPEEVRQAAQLFEQQLKSGQISNDTAQWKLQELQNPDSPTNQAAKLDLQLKQMEADYLPQEQKLKLQQLQKQIQQIGAAPYRSEQERQLDQVKLDTAREQLNQLKNPPGETIEDYAKKYLDGLAKYEDGKVLNTDALESAILTSGKSEAEMRKLYARYGLKWG